MSTTERADLEPSARELQVLRGLARGLDTQAIADELLIAHATARTVKSRLFEKLGVRTSAHAVARGYQRGYLAADPDVVDAADLMRTAQALGYRLAITPWETT